jgi:hypothetical protein
MTPLATGNLKLLRKLCPNGIAPRSVVARIGVRQSGRVAVVSVDSILDREAWRRLELAIETSSRSPGVEVLLLKINCPGTSWHGSAEAALVEARRRGVYTACHVETAFGLALDLAIRSRAVFSGPASMIGLLRSGYIGGRPSGWPSVKECDQALVAPLSDGSMERKLSPAVVNRLRRSTINGEAAELFGVVNFLSRSVRHTVRLLNRIGAKTR